MYGYIYMIMNKINGKTYVGQRKSTKLYYDDKYMGSGKYLNPGEEPNGWVPGRYTPWQGKEK